MASDAHLPKSIHAWTCPACGRASRLAGEHDRSPLCTCSDAHGRASYTTMVRRRYVLAEPTDEMEIGRLRDALVHFGQHRRDCALWRRSDGCTCGLDDALAFSTQQATESDR